MERTDKIGLAFFNVIVQIAFFLSFYEIINYCFRKYYAGYHRDLSWGISALYYFYWFTALVITSKLIKAFIKTRRASFFVDLLMMVIYFYIIYDTFSSFPLKTTLILLLSVIGFFMPYIWNKEFR